jgi:hypothetical protein
VTEAIWHTGQGAAKSLEPSGGQTGVGPSFTQNRNQPQNVAGWNTPTTGGVRRHEEPYSLWFLVDAPGAGA